MFDPLVYRKKHWQSSQIPLKKTWILDVFSKNLHPWNLTWNLKRSPWKRRFLLETIIFRFHVKFRGSSGFFRGTVALRHTHLSQRVPRQPSSRPVRMYRCFCVTMAVICWFNSRPLGPVNPSPKKSNKGSLNSFFSWWNHVSIKSVKQPGFCFFFYGPCLSQVVKDFSSQPYITHFVHSMFSFHARNKATATPDFDMEPENMPVEQGEIPTILPISQLWAEMF